MLRLLAVFLFLAAAVVAMWFEKGHYILAAAIVVPVAIWLVGQPTYLTAVVISAYAWPYRVFDLGSITIFKLANLVLLGSVLLRFVRRSKIEPLPSRFFLLLLFLLPLQLVSELRAPTGVNPHALYTFSSTWLLLLLMSQTILTPNDLQIFARIFSLNTLAIGLFLIRETNWGATLSNPYYRALGPLNEPNELAWMIIVMLGLMWSGALDLRQRLWDQLLCAAGSIVGIGAIVISASRSGTIGLMTSALTFAVLIPKTISQRILSLLLLTLLSLAVIAVAPPSFQQRVLGTVFVEKRAHRHVKLGQRDVHARIGWEMIEERPIFGHGSKGFRHRMARIFGDTGRELHSSVINLAVAYGLPAGLLYAALLFASIFFAWHLTVRWEQHRIQAVGLTALLTGTAISSLGAPRLFTPTMWSMVTLAYILHSRTFQYDLMDDSLLEDPDSLAAEHKLG